jgi:hypothetical protein
MSCRTALEKISEALNEAMEHRYERSKIQYYEYHLAIRTALMLTKTPQPFPCYTDAEAMAAISSGEQSHCLPYGARPITAALTRSTATNIVQPRICRPTILFNVCTDTSASIKFTGSRLIALAKDSSTTHVERTIARLPTEF